MNNRTACWSLSRLSSLTSFSGLWKCFTIPLMASPTPSWIWPVFNSGQEEVNDKHKHTGRKTSEAKDNVAVPRCQHYNLKMKTHFPSVGIQFKFWIKVLFGFIMMILGYLLGLVFGEMVTNLLIIPGDCCIGGVRHILSSFSVVGVISSPTRILSKLPSSTPFPNHRPQGNLQDKLVSFCSRTTRSTKHCCLFPSIQRHTHL